MPSTGTSSSWSLFLAMPERSIAAVNSSMQAFIRASFCDETVTMIFDRMPEWNSVSFNLKLGAAARDIAEPRTLLDSIPERNVASWTSLLTAFSKNFAGQQSVDNAEMVFSKMPQWDGLSCNAIAHLYSEADDLTSAAKIFDTNLQRDAVSWNSLITSCGRLVGNFDITMEVFHKMPLHSIASFTAILLGFPRRSGDDDDDNAWNWFKSLPCQDIVSWNAMIFAAAGSTQSLLLLRRMELEGFKPTYVTFATIVDCCADSAALAEGRAIHRRVLQLGFFPGNIVIGNGLINFYSRCGSIDEALEVFQGMRRRDLITWTSIVAGYAWNGFGERSAQIFHSMLLEGFDPNSVTLVNILASCSHGGLLDFGRIVFVFVTADVPGVAACREHYDCLVDLLGRSGRLEEARELMESMPFEPSLMGRMSFAASCNKQHLEQD